MEKPESDFEKLYKNECIANIEKTFPLIQKCIEESSNETEILRAVELSFEFGLKVFPVDELEKQIFQYAGRAAKTIFIRKLESLEKVNQSVANPNENYYQLINSCTEIISLFITIFMQLNDFQILTMSQVESLLLYSAEISYECFCHCNKSEEVYGSSFSFITKYLTTCFKKCCEMLELLLNFLTDKLVCEFHGKREVHILGDILMHISKCAIILMNLDVKTMAKVWKTHVGLLEKYFDYVKEDFNIAGTITYLCEIISFDADSALWNSQDDQEFNRKIKLACFNLKLVIKYCEIFSGCLSNCQKSLLSLLLKLCRCNTLHSDEEKFQKIINKGLLKQLSIGMEPLLLQLIADEKLIEECVVITKDLRHTESKVEMFAIFCCLVLKKLMHSNTQTRNLWLNESTNILHWLFLCVCNAPYKMCSNEQLPGILIQGQQKKFVDIYQYILVTVSSFVMTSTTEEFHLVEKTLIKNVMQPNPLCALLAIDIWCLLARFSGTDLCWAEVCKLTKIFHEFQYNTQRVEKWYLMLLIQRIYSLLTYTQKEKLIQNFKSLSSSEIWKFDLFFSKDSNFDIFLMHNINNSFANIVENIVYIENDFAPNYIIDSSSSDDDYKVKQIFEVQVFKLWNFHTQFLSSFLHKDNFIKIACLVTKYALPYLSSKSLLMVISKVKKLLAAQSDATSLYFTWILKGFSTITLLPDSLQQHIIKTIAEIYTALLSSEKALIKQKALENFYDFSHLTSHAEIIALSVQNCPSLKQDVTNYFQKKIREEANESTIEQLCLMHKSNFHHACHFSNAPEKQELNKGSNFSGQNLSLIVTNYQEIIERWKEYSENISKIAQELTSLQKREIQDFCTTLLNILQ